MGSWGSSVDQQRLYWGTVRGEQDKLGLPQQVAVILAVLKTAQNTREGDPWEVPLSTKKSPSPHLSSHSGKFQLLPKAGSSSCPFLHRVRTIHFPCPHPHPTTSPRLSHLEFQPDHFLFQKCDFLFWMKALPVPAAAISQAISVQAWSLLVWNESLPICCPCGIRPSPSCPHCFVSSYQPLATTGHFFSWE